VPDEDELLHYTTLYVAVFAENFCLTHFVTIPAEKIIRFCDVSIGCNEQTLHVWLNIVQVI